VKRRLVRVTEPVMGSEVVQLAINSIRTLSIDAVEQAKSGHPGTLGMERSCRLSIPASSFSEDAVSVD
jgi:Transketolase, thiamine diphosphate binding domain